MPAKDALPDGPSAGVAWVNRFLVPQLTQHFPKAPAVACLQVSPDDSSETERLRQLGHSCEMTESNAAMNLSFPDSSWDFVFSGRFPSRAPDRAARIALAGEMYRVLRSGGAVLLAPTNTAWINHSS
ncbi:MAG: class I SAM-dependent methyltransferase [Terriglobia bacterium]|nr:class I SAM-dependent methyltransferase [Terriglobia bacterium]